MGFIIEYILNGFHPKINSLHKFNHSFTLHNWVSSKYLLSAQLQKYFHTAQIQKWGIYHSNNRFLMKFYMMGHSYVQNRLYSSEVVNQQFHFLTDQNRKFSPIAKLLNYTFLSIPALFDIPIVISNIPEVVHLCLWC